MYEDEYDGMEAEYDTVPYNEEDYYRKEHEARQKQQVRRFYSETIGGVLSAVTEYARTLEQEKSNRVNIERKRKTAITVIRSERKIMLEYLVQRFGERKGLFEKYFNLIDTALQVENEEILRLALDSIQNIYQDSPGSGLGDDFRKQFDEVIRI